jgi:hypothetical protein
MPTQAADPDLAAAEAQDKLEEATEALQVGPGVDPLEALLAMEERVEDVREEIPVTLMSGQRVNFIARALRSEEIDQIRDRCTRWVKRGRGPRVQELDSQEMNALLVAAGIVSPNFKDQRILAKYATGHASEAVKKALLPGTIDGLVGKLLEVAGYTDDLVEPGKP